MRRGSPFPAIRFDVRFRPARRSTLRPGDSAATLRSHSSKATRPAHCAGKLWHAPRPHRPCQPRSTANDLCSSPSSEIVLRCGEASITLTKAGKVLIRGDYLLEPFRPA